MTLLVSEEFKKLIGSQGHDVSNCILAPSLWCFVSPMQNTSALRIFQRTRRAENANFLKGTALGKLGSIFCQLKKQLEQRVVFQWVHSWDCSCEPFF